MIDSAQRHIDRHDSAQARRQRWNPGVEIGGVGENEYVRVEALAMGAKKLGQMIGADLLLTFDDQLDVDRQRALRVEPGR